MFYRRKIILGLLQLFENRLEKIRLQKLLFLFTQQQAKAEYDFVPYKYGCFSYSATADMSTMVTRGLLGQDEKHITKKDTTDYLLQLKADDKKYLIQIKNKYERISTNALIHHTYINYPFYATHSEIAKNLLTNTELKSVTEAKPKNNKTILFTIGYEGASIEAYLVRLLKNDVKLLVDVRNNPLSMKYGFSKNQLKRYAESLGIHYVHFPEVGIQREDRQELNSQSDYNKLFSRYQNNNLTKTIETQNKILELLKSYKRIALTCFEANIFQCHRKHLAEAIEKFSTFTYEVKHI